MGVTTLILAVLFWRWCFRPKQSFLLLSAKEDRVDNRGDPSSLFFKLDMMWQYLPPWLRPSLDRAKLRFRNLDNGAIINGESTNADADRGGVRTAVMIDEMSSMANGEEIINSISPLTRTLLAVATPKGAFGAFYKLVHQWLREHPERVIHLHWTMHPLFAKGLYFTDELVTGYIDANWNGRKPRSPWYDNECSNMLGPKNIAQELDIAWNESGGRYFEEELVQKLLLKVRRPTAVGEIIMEGEKAVWRPTSTGRVRLWCPLGETGEGLSPPRSVYVIGCDIAQGTGGSQSSQSTLSIVNALTGEKVGEYAYNRVMPADFARYAVKVAKWFHGAKLIWGCQGPGVTFDMIVRQQLKYYNVFYREGDEDTAGGGGTKKAGYAEHGKPRRVMFDDYQDALMAGRFQNPSEAAVLELRQFIIASTGSIEHSAALQANDPENKGKLHGDLVIADALACRLLRDAKPVVATILREPPYGSFAWFERQQEQRETADVDW